MVTVEFDGVYDHAEVWINGQFVGGRPYGYSSFALELTPHLKFGAEDNVLAVRVDHSRFADSRWYTGSGIYRHVRLRVTDPLRIAPLGHVCHHAGGDRGCGDRADRDRRCRTAPASARDLRRAIGRPRPRRPGWWRARPSAGNRGTRART